MNLKSLHDKNIFSVYHIDYTEKNAARLLSERINELLLHYSGSFKDIVILNIGTDRSTGDSLGPLVGYKLAHVPISGLHIYGTLNEPVHAMNLSEVMELIRDGHPDALTIAVDACLGKFENVGKITVADGPLKPGAAVKKSLPEVGDFHLTGIVNVGGFMEYFVLQNTRLGIIMDMAEIIAKSLLHSIYPFLQGKKCFRKAP